MLYQARSIDIQPHSVITTKRLLRLFVAVTFVICLPITVVACIWDHDTLNQELHRFPSALEVITGKFVRHSKEFYEWRIQDRLARLKAEPNNLAWHDDLGVAYEKTGQHDKAIEVMLQKEKLKPGEYETYSNLGTFYILAGDFETGLPYIDKALAINPDAHFGREKYQKWLIEYKLASRKEGPLFFPSKEPLGDSYRRRVEDFRDYIAMRLGKESLSVAEIQAAVKGVLGMMRFADYENPLLLEALGALLTREGNEEDAKRLGVRSFLKASYVSSDPEIKKQFYEKAMIGISFQSRSRTDETSVTIEEVQADFAIELEAAKAWYADLKQKELNWIREGDDVEAKFDRLYEEEADQIQAQQREAEEEESHRSLGVGSKLRTQLAYGALSIAGIALAFAILLSFRNWIRKRPASTTPADDLD